MWLARIASRAIRKTLSCSSRIRVGPSSRPRLGRLLTLRGRGKGLILWKHGKARQDLVPSRTPNQALVAPREARNLGNGRSPMKLVAVTQWVRTGDGSSPTYPKPSQQGRSDIHVHTQQWAYGAGWNEEAGRVIEPRNAYRRGR